MASTYRFRLARASDDTHLRALLRTVAMPGAMQLTTNREPDFFRAERIGNLRSQVIVCETGEGTIVGFGVRAVRLAYIDGRFQEIAYLSTLRSLPGVRHGLLLARGYQYLRMLTERDPSAWTVTTIYGDNQLARAALTNARAGLPLYRPLGTLYTYAIGLRRTPSNRTAPDIQAGTVFDPREIASTLNAYNRQWQFAPHWRTEDLAGVSGVMDGFTLNHLACRTDGSRIAATLGVWDQAAAKQHVVTAYAWPLSWYQPVSGWVDRLGIGPALPSAGQEIRLLYGCCISATAPDPGPFSTLLDGMIRTWSGRGFDYLLIGLPNGHPLQRTVARRARMKLKSTIYLVDWDPGGGKSLPSAERPPHLEIATL